MGEVRNLLLWLLKESQEGEWIEFKENNWSPDMIGERISALANGACLSQQPFGYLVFGIRDETLDLVGTTFRPRAQKKGNESLEHWLNQHFSPRINFDILEEVVDGKHIVLFRITAAKDIPVKFGLHAFVRIGSITRKLSEFPEKERLIWNNIPNKSFPTEIAKIDLTAAEIIQYLDTQQFFDLIKAPYPTHQSTVIGKLLSEKLIVADRGRYGITNLGAITLAKNLKDFPTVSRKSPRLILYEGRDKSTTKRDIQGTKGYAAGFGLLIGFIEAQLPVNEEMSRAFRETVTMYPIAAVRELIANCLIHQNFLEPGTGPLIEIYSDRLEILNPGIPLVSTLRFIDEFQSRNEELAFLMRRFGICEERGSGIDKVIRLAELYQLPAPAFVTMEKHTKVILYAYKKFGEMDKEDKIRACYQHCVLKYISNDRMTNRSLRERFKIEPQNAALASRIIGDTLEKGLIRNEDPDSESRKYARYIPSWA